MRNTTSAKQELKRNRARMYFLEAAKEMIHAAGVESVTVRKVADAAGYSYPTLYNYFEDLNELLWETRQYMIRELVGILQQKMQASIQDAEDLKKMFRTYVEYYVESPNVFRFFYFHYLQKPNKQTQDDEPDFSAMWGESFKSFVISGRLNEKDIEAVAKTSIYVIHGMLTLHFSNNGDLSVNANLYRDLEKIVDFLLK